MKKIFFIGLIVAITGTASDVFARDSWNVGVVIGNNGVAGFSASYSNNRNFYGNVYSGNGCYYGGNRMIYTVPCPAPVIYYPPAYIQPAPMYYHIPQPRPNCYPHPRSRRHHHR